MALRNIAHNLGKRRITIRTAEIWAAAVIVPLGAGWRPLEPGRTTEKKIKNDCVE